jgi:U3 small nucleolar RNA-associated protein 22
VVAGRVAGLAGACMEVVRGEGRREGGLGLEGARGLFASGLEEYDFLVYLERTVVKGGKVKGRKGKYRNLEVAEETDADAVGFDPVREYLGDLEAVFKGVALFFYGASGDGGDVIAGLWRPAVKGKREWKVRLGWSSVPIREKGEADGERKVMAELNTKAILKEIEIMGEGLVKEVKTRSS